MKCRKYHKYNQIIKDCLDKLVKDMELIVKCNKSNKKLKCVKNWKKWKKKNIGKKRKFKIIVKNKLKEKENWPNNV
jgi:hypothetical protein